MPWIWILVNLSMSMLFLIQQVLFSVQKVSATISHIVGKQFVSPLLIDLQWAWIGAPKVIANVSMSSRSTLPFLKVSIVVKCEPNAATKISKFSDQIDANCNGLLTNTVGNNELNR